MSMSWSTPSAGEHAILVVEDDPAIREGLVDALGFEGYRVLTAPDAPAGRDSALTSGCHLVLLDLMLPGGDGFSILSEVRMLRPELPVIILTAKGREVDRVRGLELGADDYVIKPFSVRELLARVEAVLRRCAQTETQTRDALTRLVVPGGLADLARRELRFEDGSRCDLTDREAALLAYLARHRTRAVGRAELLREVWRIAARDGPSRTVDMQIARLRDKLRDSPEDPHVIITVRGKGYMLGSS